MLAPAVGQNAKPKADDLFGQAKILTLHLDVAAKEFDAMPPALPGFPGRRSPKKPRRRDRPRRTSSIRTSRGSRRMSPRTARPQKGRASATPATSPISPRPGSEAAAQDRVRQVRRPAIPRPSAFSSSTRCRWTRRRAAKCWRTPCSGRPACRRRAPPSPRSRSPSPASTTRSISAFTPPSRRSWTPFLDRSLRHRQGTLLKPFQVRSVDYLGDDWDRYKGQYRPQCEATKEEAKRVIEFAKLVNQAERRASSRSRSTRSSTWTSSCASWPPTH